MNQHRTTAIILTRVNYGESDRIITVLTPDVGKLSLMAKGVRKIKSKLAGGIELFSVSEISYVPGKGGLNTLVSSRLLRHYGSIVADINRTMLGYELIKLLHELTEEEPEKAYYELIELIFASLDQPSMSIELIRVWVSAQLLRLAGHTPNLRSDIEGSSLDPTRRYVFDYDKVAFRVANEGVFGANEIKFVRLIFGTNEPVVLSRVSGIDHLTEVAAPLVVTLRRLQLHK